RIVARFGRKFVEAHAASRSAFARRQQATQCICAPIPASLPAAAPATQKTNHNKGRPSRTSKLRCPNPLGRTMVEGTGFGPVYAKRSDLQSDGFNHSPTPPRQRLWVGTTRF